MPTLRTITVGGPRLTLLLALLAGLGLGQMWLAVPAAMAQDGRIREIMVSGNRRVEPETVRSYLRFAVGDAYDPAKVDQSVRALFGTGLFSDVSIDHQGPVVTVKVV
jgi:outer membrane protein insertion porin family